MKTPAQRQQFLIDNPMTRFYDDDKTIAIMNALLLSDLFRLNDWGQLGHHAESRRIASAVVILNAAAPIVWC